MRTLSVAVSLPQSHAHDACARVRRTAVRTTGAHTPCAWRVGKRSVRASSGQRAPHHERGLVQRRDPELGELRALREDVQSARPARPGTRLEQLADLCGRRPRTAGRPSSPAGTRTRPAAVVHRAAAVRASDATYGSRIAAAARRAPRGRRPPARGPSTAGVRAERVAFEDLEGPGGVAA